MQPVRIDQLESGYGKDVVLRVANFAVESGDFLRILGPNGGGKSTLLNVLLGRKTFTGSVSIYGDSEPPFELAKGQVAYLAQDANQVDPNFPIRVKDVVAMGLLGRSRTWLRLSQDDRNAIQEALDAVQMGHLGKKRIGTLSGGQRQRVMLARAIVRKPDLLLLDEPFTAIDPKGRGAFADLLARLNQSGTTILAVCHEPELLEGIANRTVSIDVELAEVEVNHGA